MKYYIQYNSGNFIGYPPHAPNSPYYVIWRESGSHYDDFNNVMNTFIFNNFEELLSYYKRNILLPLNGKSQEYNISLSDTDWSIIENIWNNYKDLT
jgi:hypothetical protein